MVFMWRWNCRKTLGPLCRQKALYASRTTNVVKEDILCWLIWSKWTHSKVESLIRLIYWRTTNSYYRLRLVSTTTACTAHLIWFVVIIIDSTPMRVCSKVITVITMWISCTISCVNTLLWLLKWMANLNWLLNCVKIITEDLQQQLFI